MKNWDWKATLLAILTIVLLIIIGSAVLLAFAFKSPVLSFLKKDPAYFEQIATACDDLLLLHPLGTNEFVYPSVDAPSLPPVIRELHPRKIIISSNRVQFISGGGRMGFGIAWEPQYDNPTNWTLIVCAESHDRIAYVRAGKPAGK